MEVIQKRKRKLQSFFESSSSKIAKLRVLSVIESIYENGSPKEELDDLINFVESSNFQEDGNIDYIEKLVRVLCLHCSKYEYKRIIELAEILYNKILIGESIDINQLLKILVFAKNNPPYDVEKIDIANISKKILLIYYYKQEFVMAKKYANIVLDIFKDLENTFEIASIAMFIGDLNTKLLYWEDAKDMFELSQSSYYECGFLQGCNIANQRIEYVRSNCLDIQEYSHAVNRWSKDHSHPNVYHLQKLK